MNIQYILYSIWNTTIAIRRVQVQYRIHPKILYGLYEHTQYRGSMYVHTYSSTLSYDPTTPGVVDTGTGVCACMHMVWQTSKYSQTILYRPN